MDSEQKLLLLKVAILQKKTFPAQTAVLVCGPGNCFTSCVFQEVLFAVVCRRGDRNSGKQVLPSLLHFAEHTMEKDAGQVSIFPRMN